MPERRARSSQMQCSVGLPPVVLPPGHLSRVGEQVLPADMMVLPHLGAAQPAEVALGLVRAGAVPGERLGVVDPPHLVVGVQRIPSSRLVRMDDGAGGDPLAQEGNRVGFLADHEGKCSAAPLAGDHDRLALAGLLHREAAVLAVLPSILLLHGAADISAVDFDHAAQVALHLLGADRFPDLVSQDESGFVLDVQVPAELEGGDALDGRNEYRDRCEVIPDRQLAGGEDGPGRDAKLVVATLALPDPTCGIGVDGAAAAAGAERFAFIVREPDRDEGCVRLVVGHAEDRLEAQRPGGGGEEEVLRHLRPASGF